MHNFFCTLDRLRYTLKKQQSQHALRTDRSGFKVETKRDEDRCPQII